MFSYPLNNRLSERGRGEVPFRNKAPARIRVIRSNRWNRFDRVRELYWKNRDLTESIWDVWGVLEWLSLCPVERTARNLPSLILHL